jgi:hypothetical protein
MRRLRKTIVLALAAFGAYRAWELLSPKLDMTRDHHATKAQDRIDPTPPEAATTAEQSAGDTAAGRASNEAVGSLTDDAAAGIDLTRQEANVAGSSGRPGSPPATDISLGTTTPSSG